MNQTQSPGAVEVPPELGDFLKAVGAKFGPVAQEKLDLVLKGRLTFGDVLGFSKEKQYELAKEGYRHLQANRLEEAMKIFSGLQALDPYDAYFHASLGTIAVEMESYEEAETLFTKALSINPFSVHALASRGEVRVLLGRKAEGVVDLEAAVKNDPQAKQLAGQRARVLLEQLKRPPGAPAASAPPAGAGARTAAHPPPKPSTKR